MISNRPLSIFPTLSLDSGGNENNGNRGKGNGKSKCQFPNIVNDGVCDAKTNNLQCDFDGGDCCLNQIIAACYDCICYEDGTRHPEEKGINKHPVLSIAKL